MRTTVNIDGRLLEDAKAAARQCGNTLGQFVERAVRRELTDPPAAEAPAIPTYPGKSGPSTGIDLRSNRAIADFLDDTGS